MLESGFICPSNSLWASQIVMVQKKDSKLHLCVNFQQLNATTVKDEHPLPSTDDLDALNGTCWFSILDLKSRSWQVPIHEADKPKTAFRTSSGQLYEFNQVPFGLYNSPATFLNLMDCVLTSLNWKTCLFYLDDIIVFLKTWEEHLECLEGVFQGFQGAKLKLGASKCTLAAPEVGHLGHCVTRDSLLPNPMLLQVIREIPMLQNMKEVQSFWAWLVITDDM